MYRTRDLLDDRRANHYTKVVINVTLNFYMALGLLSFHCSFRYALTTRCVIAGENCTNHTRDYNKR